MGAMLVVVLKATFGIQFRICICIPPEFYYVMGCADNQMNEHSMEWS